MLSACILHQLLKVALYRFELTCAERLVLCGTHRMAFVVADTVKAQIAGLHESKNLQRPSLLLATKNFEQKRMCVSSRAGCPFEIFFEKMSSDLDKISNPDAQLEEEDKEDHDNEDRTGTLHDESLSYKESVGKIEKVERDECDQPDTSERSTKQCQERNLRPARRCKYGSACKFRMNCSYIHATYEDSLKMEYLFCYCMDPLCCRPHPDRVPPPRQKRMRDDDTDDRREYNHRILCTNCKKPGHKVMYCPHLRCDYCKRYGHIASVCEDRRIDRNRRI